MFGAWRGHAPSRSLRRRGSGLLAIVAVLLTVLLSGVWPGGMPGALAAEPPAEARLTISFSPLTAAAAAQDARADGTVTVTGSILVENRGGTALPGGELDLAVAGPAFTSLAEKQAWLAARIAPAPLPPETVVAHLHTDELAGKAEVEVPFRFDLPVPVGAQTTAQVLGAAAQLHTEGDPIEGRAALLLPGEQPAHPANVSTIVPVTAPLGSAPLVPAAQLAKLTASEGSLTALLAAVRETNATLAIDPRVLASIRALGEDAPNTAQRWLAELERLGNASFPLEFADANRELLAAIDLAAPFDEHSFSFETRWHTFDPASLPEPSGAPTPPPGASSPAASQPGAEPPAATDAQPGSAAQLDATGRPTTDTLLAFPYTRPELRWPLAGYADAPGDGELVVADSAQLAGDLDLARGSLAASGDGQLLVVPAELNAAFHTAVTSDSQVRRTAATGDLATTLALLGGTGPVPVTLAAPRDGLNPAYYTAAMQALTAANVATTDAAPAPASTPDQLPRYALTATALDDDTLQLGTQLRASERDGLTLADLYDSPPDVRQQLRVNLVAATSNRALETGTLTQAATGYASFATGARSGVTLEPGSEVQLIGHESALPVFITNATDRPVTVRVEARPNSGHLQAHGSTEVRVEANSVSRAQIPVTAIANGTTTVTVSLWAGPEVQLPSEQRFVVNVHADLETVAIVVVVVLVVGLVAAGTWRTIRRRRREAAQSQPE